MALSFFENSSSQNFLHFSFQMNTIFVKKNLLIFFDLKKILIVFGPNAIFQIIQFHLEKFHKKSNLLTDR